jgi:hypothetical protein
MAVVTWLVIGYRLGGPWRRLAAAIVSARHARWWLLA